MQSLHAQLSLENEGGAVREATMDQLVERCLCLQVMQSTPESNQSENLLLILLESLALLWRKQSAMQRRKDSRGRGLEMLPYLLTLWKAARSLDARISMALLSIFRSWAKTQETTVRTILIKAGMVQALPIMFETKKQGSPPSPLWPHGLGLMKDLMFRAKSTEKEAMYKEWMDHVIHALPNEDCTEPATACLWNWAVQESIALRMAVHVRLWATLARCQPTFTSLGAQRNTLSTVGSILSVCSSRLEKVPSPVATHSTWTMDFLIQNLESVDGDLRRRAVRTIRCLSVCPWGREMLQQHFGDRNKLFQRLTRTLTNQEEQDDTRVQVCLTMSNWLPHLHQNWSHVGPYIEHSLVTIIQDKKTTDKVIMHSIQVLSTCVEFSPWKRGSGCLSEEFFARIHDVLKDHATDQEYHNLMVALLRQIVNKTNNEPGQPVLANAKVVDILALLLSEFENSTTVAVETLKEVVQHEAIRKYCVEHDTLLTHLVNVCIVSSGERKAQAKSLLVSLVSDL